MKKYLRSRRAAIAYVAVFAAIGAVTVGVYAAAAARGFAARGFVAIFARARD